MSVRQIAERRTCWVCYGTDEDIVLKWLRPCMCRGSAKYVHVKCLQRWIDEKHRQNPTLQVHCPQCNYAYHINYPQMGFGVKSLDILEKYIHKVCPYVAASALMGSIYWTSVTYGAVTVMQILGHKEGLSVMEKADPIFLFLGLPAIPLGLIIAKLLRWEEALLKLWRRISTKLPFFGTTEASSGWITSREMIEDRLPVSYTRVLVGALVFPSISTFVGKLLFRSIKSNFQRSLLGGTTYFLSKGFLKMYYLEMSYRRRSQREIVPYDGDGDSDELEEASP
ncbi:MARCH5 [Bugula neritina]|uniref:E3 ubiquitin-protein ligase MARCHF5 n=1 Tax=Bugula neritina TaxID=10212 RepID=A0A7J7J0F2_BUGNE|nr:MARCH5 [Bugula neritina]